MDQTSFETYVNIPTTCVKLNYNLIANFEKYINIVKIENYKNILLSNNSLRVYINK